MNRRNFLRSAASTTIIAAAHLDSTAQAPHIPVVDCHIHLFDPTRPGGVPWPEQSDTILYHPALPERYARLATPHGVVGAIAVECSPWLIDNFWLQDLIEKNPLMLGYVGDLLPDSADFGATLDRLQRSPFFLGIRYGNLWSRSLRASIENPVFIDALKALAQAGLVFETANPNPTLIAAVLRLTDQVPTLRVVIDHLPHAEIPQDPSARAAYESDLRSLSQRQDVYVKGSEILHRISDRVPTDLVAYKSNLDQIWDLFGDDRMLFGSDWPNSDSVANCEQTFAIAKAYISTRSRSAQEKYYLRNSTKVYRWKARTPDQRT